MAITNPITHFFEIAATRFGATPLLAWVHLDKSTSDRYEHKKCSFVKINMPIHPFCFYHFYRYTGICSSVYSNTTHKFLDLPLFLDLFSPLTPVSDAFFHREHRSEHFFDFCLLQNETYHVNRFKISKKEFIDIIYRSMRVPCISS